MAHRYYRRVDRAISWLYLAVVLDVYSRLVVGWAMASHREESLVEAALWMALGRRQPVEELLHHSDRGRKSHQLGLSIRAGPVSHSGEHERQRRLL